MIVRELFRKWGVDGYIKHCEEVYKFYSKRRIICENLAKKYLDGKCDLYIQLYCSCDHEDNDDDDGDDNDNDDDGDDNDDDGDDDDGDDDDGGDGGDDDDGDDGDDDDR